MTACAAAMASPGPARPDDGAASGGSAAPAGGASDAQVRGREVRLPCVPRSRRAYALPQAEEAEGDALAAATPHTKAWARKQNEHLSRMLQSGPGNWDAAEREVRGGARPPGAALIAARRCWLPLRGAPAPTLRARTRTRRQPAGSAARRRLASKPRPRWLLRPLGRPQRLYRLRARCRPTTPSRCVPQRRWLGGALHAGVCAAGCRA